MMDSIGGAAIEEALKVRPELGDETLSVVFLHDAGLKRSQQMFADLNRHAISPHEVAWGSL